MFVLAAIHPVGFLPWEFERGKRSGRDIASVYAEKPNAASHESQCQSQVYNK